jgi:hypothetical protein
MRITRQLTVWREIGTVRKVRKRIGRWGKGFFKRGGLNQPEPAASDRAFSQGCIALGLPSRLERAGPDSGDGGCLK